ncbi:MAG: peptide chain release factor 3, partial [Pseudooceanicola nanhaiensis]
TSARWIKGDKQAIEKFANINKQHIAYDNDGDPVYLTRLQWDIDRVERDHPEITLTATKEMMV